MIRFRLKVMNTDNKTVQSDQSYTFEPEMFLQGLIRAFVLLDKRYYLIEYNNSPQNIMVEVAKVIAKVMNKKDVHGFYFTSSKGMQRSHILNVTYARGDEKQVVKEACKYYNFKLKDFKNVYTFCKQAIILKQELGLNAMNIARDTNAECVKLYGKKLENIW